MSERKIDRDEWEIHQLCVHITCACGYELWYDGQDDGRCECGRLYVVRINVALEIGDGA